MRQNACLSTNSRKAGSSRDHLFLSPDFHELWSSVMSICLFTEVMVAMGCISIGIGDRSSALLMSLMALQLMLVDQNPFWPCFNCIHKH